MLIAPHLIAALPEQQSTPGCIQANTALGTMLMWEMHYPKD